MKTTTRRKAKSPAPAISATVAKLIQQIQDEAQAATLEALSAKDGIAVFHGIDWATANKTIEADEINIYDETGNRFEAYRRHEEPLGWVGVSYMRGYWHPSYWFLKETRFDTCGKKWVCDLDRYLVDDFGYLVPVNGSVA